MLTVSKNLPGARWFIGMFVGALLAWFLTSELVRSPHTFLCRIVYEQGVSEYHKAHKYEESAEERGHLASAERWFRQCIAIRKHGHCRPDSQGMCVYGMRGLTLKRLGRYEEAVQMYTAEIESAKSLMGTNHAMVAESWVSIGVVRELQGHFADAESAYLKARAIEQKNGGSKFQGYSKFHINALYEKWATNANLSASFYRQLGRYDVAELFLKQALQIRQKLGAKNKEYAIVLTNLGSIYWKMGRNEEAEPFLEEAVSIGEKVLGREHPATLTFLCNLGNLYSCAGRNKEAETILIRTLETRRKLLGEGHPDTTISMNNLAGVYTDQGRYAEAESLLRSALEFDRKSLGPYHPNVAIRLNGLARLYALQKQHLKCEPLYVEALKIRECSLGANHPDTLDSRENLRKLHEAMKSKR